MHYNSDNMLLIKFNLVVEYNFKETFLNTFSNLVKKMISQMIHDTVTMKDKTFVKYLNFWRKKNNFYQNQKKSK